MFIAGVDEAGRGPLAGPVVAAAVILNPDAMPSGLQDSKKLSEKARLQLYDSIYAQAHAVAIGHASVAEIDALNILQASLLAMQRAVSQLTLKPDRVLVDGNQMPNIPYPGEAIIKGDSKIPEISAASIIAKVTRDSLLMTLDVQFPQYGFAKHKGYPTKQHIQALAAHGVTLHHRRSFSPVAKCLMQETSAANVQETETFI